MHKVTKVFTITVTDILETISGTAKNDVLKGGIGLDRLLGLAGNDTLLGYAGNDVLEGGDGNDVLIGGAGADRLLGGNGSDTASYAGAKAGLVASLAMPSINTGDAKGDTYSSIENLTGTFHADKLVGDANANVLNGGAGNDTLEGGDGNDLLIGGAGADRLFGGNGTDTASYVDAKAVVVASLAAPSINKGDAGGDTYSSVENLSGSSHADRLTGDTKANVIDGGAGNDLLSGGAGSDQIIGGLGFDDLYGGTGSDRFVFRSAKELGTSKTATDTIFDFSQKEKDVIDFAAIDANIGKSGNQAFSFIDTAKFSKKAGELRYEKTKANTFVYGDVNGDGTADFVLHIDAVLSLKPGDFLL
ncbi:protease [Shinella curvata]|uniref:Protease n=1 Tax=Shinella curvata TaxID=1817964 RepID=A0ABT8XEY4_9HYPH|nr:calcium-binding protein [Shinella curvata]MCJ8052837.1 protease [Shinella curvata]MDO6122168.1 protease [Shinella curvata]